MKVVFVLKFLFVLVICFVLGCLSALLEVFLKKLELKKYGLTSFGNIYLDRLQVISCKFQSGKKITKDDLMFLQAFQYYIETGGLVGK